MSSQHIDVVVSTYGERSRICETAASICRGTHENFTLWILDQNEHDHIRRCLAGQMAEDSRIRLLPMPLRGISATRNAGVALSDAPLIAFINDDCVAAPGWLTNLLAELEDQCTWMVYGRVLPAPQRCRTTDEVVLAVKLSVRRQVFRNNRLNLSFGHGHNMAVRRDRFLELGGFDQCIGAGGALGSWDDRDLGYRALRAGGQLVYTPHAIVFHDHWQSWHAARASFRNYGIGAGAAVAKYLRTGDPAAVYLFFEWMLSQGLRQIISGLLKWHSWGKIALGVSQFVYPWVGLVRGLRHKLDRAKILFR